MQPFVWQNDTSVSRSSWCWTADHVYKSVRELLGELLEVVSKNGNLLLNVGPKPDGTIAEPEVRMLESIGAWLSVNGEAVYGTVPYTIPGEGPLQVKEGSFIDGAASVFSAEDFRFTAATRRHRVLLYVSTARWPEGDEVVLTALGTRLQLEPRDVSDVADARRRGIPPVASRPRRPARDAARRAAGRERLLAEDLASSRTSPPAALGHRLGSRLTADVPRSPSPGADEG